MSPGRKRVNETLEESGTRTLKNHLIPRNYSPESILAQRKGYQSPTTWAQELRVLMAQDSMNRGPEARDALILAQSLRAYGGHCLVASSGGGLAPYLKSVEALHATANLDRAGLFSTPGNCRRLLHLAQGFKANLVTVRSRTAAHPACDTARKCNLKVITYFNQPYECRNLIQYRKNRKLTSGERVIVPSRFMFDHVKKLYKVEAERLVVIPEPVDLHALDNAATNLKQVNELRNYLGLIEGRPIILIKGHSSYWQGQHILIEALGKLKKTHIYALFLDFGTVDSKYREELDKLIKRSALEEKVKFINIEEMNARQTTRQFNHHLFVALADVCVSASLEPEGFLRGIAEGMCLGKACIAPNHGAAPEQIIHHETGWLFSPGSIPELAQAINEALNLLPEQRQNLCQWSKESMRPHVSSNKVSDQQIDLFLSLVTS